MKYILLTIISSILFLSSFESASFLKHAIERPVYDPSSQTTPRPGEVIDRFNNIEVYYNGNVTNVFGRNTTYDGYNLGLNYQCVEYIKRFYYYQYDHKMPDSYGHAKNFWDPELNDRQFNKKRGLYQFNNGSEYRPLPGDIFVFDGTDTNPFGHCGIVTVSVGEKCEIIQQNVGEKTREILKVQNINGKYFVMDKDALGWLRKG